MKLEDGTLTLSATDLSSHFECERKVWLNLEVAAKKLEVRIRAVFARGYGVEGSVNDSIPSSSMAVSTSSKAS